MRVAVLLDVPPGRLGCPPDEDEERDGGDEGAAELQAPADFGDLVDGKIG